MKRVERLKENINSAENIDCAMNILFEKMDEAIKDIENGNILSEEEFWSEIDVF